MAKKRLFLIDGNSLLYRSYYAIHELSNSKGFPTNAIYGFISTLRKIIKQEKPHYLGIAFDVKGPTIRHKMFKDYKANRKPMPEDLILQIPVLKKVINALNIPFFEYENYEADDVLGSLACIGHSHGLDTVIVSTDKDLLQTVNKSTTAYNPVKGIYLDEIKVKETFGIAPSQIVDVIALWGDSCDNIPGVPGIGEKTSKALINQFGSLDNLLKNLDKIKKTLKENIENNLDQLKLSQKLATIEQGLSLNFDVESLSVSKPNIEKLIPLLQELEFSSLLSEYTKANDKGYKSYEIIMDESRLKELVSQIKKIGFVSLDTETDNPMPTRARLVGMSFSVEPGHAFYLPLCHDYSNAPEQISKDKAFKLLEEVLTDPAIKKIGQNIKYDYIVLKKEGIILQGIDLDTMVLSYLLEPNWGKHNLGKLALTYLQVQTTSYYEIVGKGKNEKTMNTVDIDKVAPYACQDADITLQLGYLLWPKVQERKAAALYRNIELPLIEVLADMEMWGIMIDSGAMKNLSDELQEELEHLEGKIYDESGEKFNINSPQQLAHILFEKKGIKPSKKTKKTRSFSTNVTVLRELARDHTIARYILEYRKLAKLKSTYADSLPLLINPETGRIHTSYNQTVVATGRLSSSDPNLQNIPVRGELGKRIRQAFVPAQGTLFISADYSQIELRVLAHLSEDSSLIETFLHDRDIHQETVDQVFRNASMLFEEEQRRRAKIINFSIIYGTSAFSLAKELNTSVAEAQRFINIYFEKHPRVQAFLEKSVRDAMEKGFSKTLFGRIRQVPELKHKNKIIQQTGCRIALNTPIQGTAADLIKKAMIDIWNEIKKRKLKTKMILQVHDELVFETPREECDKLEELVKDKMENVFPMKVPLKVHVGRGINWAEAK